MKAIVTSDDLSRTLDSLVKWQDKATKAADEAAQLAAENATLRKQLEYAIGNIEGCIAGDDAPSTVIARNGREALAATPHPRVARMLAAEALADAYTDDLDGDICDERTVAYRALRDAK